MRTQKGEMKGEGGGTEARSNKKKVEGEKDDTKKNGKSVDRKKKRKDTQVKVAEEIRERLKINKKGQAKKIIK